MFVCLQLTKAAAGAGTAGTVSRPSEVPAAWAEAVRAELCASMWRNCGIVRQRKGLKVCLIVRVRSVCVVCLVCVCLCLHKSL